MPKATKSRKSAAKKMKDLKVGKTQSKKVKGGMYAMYSKAKKK